MLTERKAERLFKIGAGISFVPFVPVLWHAFELAFVTKTIDPHPALILFSVLLLSSNILRLPHLLKNNRLVFKQLFSVFIMNLFIVAFYFMALAT